MGNHNSSSLRSSRGRKSTRVSFSLNSHVPAHQEKPDKRRLRQVAAQSKVKRSHKVSQDIRCSCENASEEGECYSGTNSYSGVGSSGVCSGGSDSTELNCSEGESSSPQSCCCTSDSSMTATAEKEVPDQARDQLQGCLKQDAHDAETNDNEVNDDECWLTQNTPLAPVPVTQSDQCPEFMYLRDQQHQVHMQQPEKHLDCFSSEKVVVSAVTDSGKNNFLQQQQQQQDQQQQLQQSEQRQPQQQFPQLFGHQQQPQQQQQQQSFIQPSSFTAASQNPYYSCIQQQQQEQPRQLPEMHSQQQFYNAPPAFYSSSAAAAPTAAVVNDPVQEKPNLSSPVIPTATSISEKPSAAEETTVQRTVYVPQNWTSVISFVQGTDMEAIMRQCRVNLTVSCCSVECSRREKDTLGTVRKRAVHICAKRTEDITAAIKELMVSMPVLMSQPDLPERSWLTSAAEQEDQQQQQQKQASLSASRTEAGGDYCSGDVDASANAFSSEDFGNQGETMTAEQPCAAESRGAAVNRRQLNESRPVVLEVDVENTSSGLLPFFPGSCDRRGAVVSARSGCSIEITDRLRRRPGGEERRILRVQAPTMSAMEKCARLLDLHFPSMGARGHFRELRERSDSGAKHLRFA